MPTACSPQDCTSCTSMIGGRPGLYKYLLKIRAVIPLPPVSVRFRFLSSAFLFSSYTVPPLSTKDPVTSLPFPPLHLLCPVILSSISALPCIVRLSSSNPCLSHSPYVLSFFHIIMYAHVCGCGSAASFASLQVSSPLYIIKGTENK